jgi:hypothetical protein
VVDLAQLVDRAAGARAIRLVQPAAPWSGARGDAEALEAWLRSASGR